MNMKKLVAGIMACCIVGGTMPNAVNFADNTVITASAVDEEEYTEGTYEQLTYKKYSDYIEISGCDKSATEVVIPAEIEGLPVTSIGDSAFQFSGLTSVTIPDSVTTIKNIAFACCSSLTSIEIPDSVTSIEGGAFTACSSLTSIIIPDSVTNIGAGTFLNTPWLKAKQKENPLVIVNNILIDGQTCSGDVVIPDGVTTIVGMAFFNCKALTSVTILNPECEIYDNERVISDTATIYGYENSTAQAYAEKYNRKFEIIGEAPETTGGNVLIGDANCDGTVDLADATAIIQHIGNEDKYGLSAQGLANADCNNDGVITGSDALAIQKLEAKLISTLPDLN